MQENSRRPKGRDSVLSTLNVTIEALNLAKEICSVTPAKAAFGSVSVLLTMVKVCLLQLLDNSLLVHIFIYPGVDDE